MSDNNNILVNGDFESTSADEATGAVDHGSWFTAEAIDGWQATEGLIEIQDTPSQGGATPVDPTGILSSGSVLELDSYDYNARCWYANGRDADSTVEQNFTLEENSSFTFGFSYAATCSAKTSDFSVTITDADGNVVLFQEFSAKENNLEVAWQRFEAELELEAGTYTLSFSSAQYEDRDTVGALIDNVSLVDTGPSAEDDCFTLDLGESEILNVDALMGTETETVAVLDEDFSGTRHLKRLDTVASSDLAAKDGAAFSNACSDGVLLFEPVDVSDLDSSRLSFAIETDGRNRSGFEAAGSRYGDTVRVEISVDGGDFILLDLFEVRPEDIGLRGDQQTFIGSLTGQTFSADQATLSYDLPDGASSVQLRFITNLSAYDEIIKFDDVLIEGERTVETGYESGLLANDTDGNGEPLEIISAEGVDLFDYVEQNVTVLEENFDDAGRNLEKLDTVEDSDLRGKNGAARATKRSDGTLEFAEVDIDGLDNETFSFSLNADLLGSQKFESYGWARDFVKVEARFDDGSYQTIDVFDVEWRGGEQVFVGRNSGQEVAVADGFVDLSYDLSALAGEASTAELRLIAEVTSRGEIFEVDDVRLAGTFTERKGDGIATLTLDSGAIVTLKSDGSYSYNANGKFAYLAEGEETTDSFSYTVRDASGNTDTATVTIKLVGTNEDVIVGPADLEGAVAELVDGDPGENSATLSDSGVIAFTDVDLIDNHVVTFDANANGYVGDFEAVLTGEGEVTWTFSVNDADLDALSEGETLVQTYDVTIDDQNGGSATRTVTLTITGSADGPVNTPPQVVGSIDDQSVAEQGVLLFETADVFADADAGDSLTFSATLSGGDPLPDWITINELTGTVQVAPGETDSGDLVLSVTATDESGATASVPVVLTVQDRQDGKVADGYVAGATVFADANGNGLLDAGEVSTTTDADGDFTLIGGTGDLVMFGGTDISTGLAFKGTLKAPAGSTVVTPLTTLVVAFAEQSDPANPDFTQAEADLKAALNLPDLNLTQVDPVALAVSGDADGVELLATQIKVQNTVLQVSAVVEGANEGNAAVDQETVIQSAFEGLAQSISQTPDFSLEDSGDAASIIDNTLAQTATNTGTTAPTVEPDVVQTATSVISQSNNAIENIDYQEGSTDPIATLEQIAQVAIVSQDEASEELESAAASGTVSTELSDLETGFEAAVDAVEDRVGDVDGTSDGAQSEFLVNETASGSQGAPNIVGLSGGGFVAVWSSNRARIFDENGVATTGEIVLGSGAIPDVAATDTGGFVAVYNGAGVKAKVFDADGNETLAEFTVSETPVSLGSDGTKVTVLDNGNFAFTWYGQPQGQNSADLFEIRGRVFASDGTPVSDEFIASVNTEDFQGYPDIAALQNGQFVITWTDIFYPDTGGNLVNNFARVFNADGTPATGDIELGSDLVEYEIFPKVAVLDNGNFVIAWHQQNEVFAKILDAAGNEIVAEFVVNEITDGSQSTMEITALSGNRFIATWASSDGLDDTSGYGIKARVFDGAGNPLGSEFLVNQNTDANQFEPTVTELSNGGYAVAWRTDDASVDGVGSAIVARVFDASGLPVSVEEGTLNFTQSELLALDADPGNDAFTIVSVTALSEKGATVTLNPDGSVTYDPSSSTELLNFSQNALVPDTITFLVDDGAGGQTTTTVTLSVNGLNNAPVASAISLASVTEDDASQTIDLLATASDADGDGLSVVSVSATDNLGNAVTVTDNGNGTISLDPNQFDFLVAGENRVVTISYGVSDGTETTANTATITVTGANESGTPGDDILIGSANDDVMSGLGGNDIIRGQGGNDTIDGGDGDDEIDGGAGNDTVSVGSGFNLVVGSTGNDTTDVTGSTDTFFDYSAFSDDFTVNVATAGATVNKGASGTDSVTGIDQLAPEIDSVGFNTGSGTDTFTVDVDPDLFVGIDAGAGDDTITVTNGFVRVSYRSATTSGITYNSDNGARVSGTVTGADFGTDALSNVNEIRGSEFDDTFNGGDGDERFILRGGNDTVDGGAGFDMVRFDRPGVGAVTVDLALGTATGTIDGNAFSHTLSNIERIRGSRNDDDTISGSGADERLEGRGGNDTLSGLGGNDSLRGEDGNDILSGGDGDDFLDGGDGDDLIEGGQGWDGIDTGAGNDTLVIGADALNESDWISDFDPANDTIDIEGALTTLSSAPAALSDVLQIADYGGEARLIWFADNGNIQEIMTLNGIGAGAQIRIQTAPGVSQLVTVVSGVTITGTNGDDSIFASTPGNDTYFGLDGNDDFQASDGNDVIDGGDGFDLVFYEQISSGVIIDLDQGTATWATGSDTLISIEAVHGSGFDDTITLTNDDQYVFARAGNDTLFGLDGNDNFIAGSGNDIIDGGNGDFDNVDYQDDGFDQAGATFQGVTVDLAAGTATDGWGDTDTLISIESVSGSDLDDTISGDAGDNILSGLGGNDTIDGGAGNDLIDGGDGDDIITVGTGFNRVVGSSGNDTVDVSNGTATVSDTVFDFFDTSVTLNVTLTGASGTIDKGAAGIDTITGIDNLDGNQGDALLIDSGFGNDIYTIDVDQDLFVGIDARGGDDTINVTSGAVRVSYRSASTSGITFLSDDGARVSGTVTGADFGTDTLANVNEIRGTDFDDTFTGGAGDERFILRGGNDTVDGGAGFDTVRFDRNGIGPVTVDLSVGSATGTIDGNAFSHTLSNVERVRGSRNDDDIISGSAADERFDGRGGNDTLSGLGGNDDLRGEGGDDLLAGGAGDDTIDGGDGTDIAEYTGNRSDYAVSENNGVITIVDTRAGAPDGTDTVVNVETFRFADGDVSAASLLSNSTVGPVTDSDASANEIAENAAAGTIVGITASATDPDAGDTVSYSVNDTRFTVDANGVVTVAAGAVFNAEAESSIDIVVTATSSDTSTSTETFTIAVTDVNEFAVGPVTDSNAAANEIAEDATAGAVVGITATATDADLTDTVSYSVNDTRFAVDANGVVTVAAGAVFDAEAESSIDIVVTATSSDTSTSTETFTIVVTDVNEFAVGPATDSNAAANEIAEDATAGAVVGITATATDADLTDTVSYSVNDTRFAVDANGVVTVAAGAVFDAEAESSIDIVVTATSSDTSTSTETFTIAVTDVNEFAVGPVTDSNAAANEIAEDATAGTIVGITATATDADLTDTVSYSVNDTRFAVDANGVVTVAAGAVFDAEAESSIDIVVTATSSDTSTSTETFTIAVTDVNEFAVGPVTDSNAAANEIAEDATAGTIVGITATATDADLTDTVSYSVNDTRFAIDANGVVTVAAGAVFDAEAESSIDIVVTATSSDTSTSTETFTIAVTDVNEFAVGPVTDSNAAANEIAEDATDGTIVGITATATDADLTDTVSYSVNDTRFAVDANGVVTVAAGAVFDAEAESSIDIVVTATSSDTSTSTETFTIAVTDVNEFAVGPVTDSNAAANEITEDATAGTIVGITATATDADLTDTVSYSVNDTRFAVDANGVVTVAAGAVFDAEAESSIDIVVTATSSDTSTSTETFTIAVTDVNEFAVGPVTDSNAAANEIADNATVGTIVGISATASDADLTDTVSYSVNDTRFAVDANGVVTVAAGAVFDAEAESSIDIIVTATSSDTSTSTETFTIAVTDANGFAVGPVTDSDATADAVAENATAGTTVGITASATDPDAGDTVSYTVDDGRFVVAANGVVSVASGAVFDFETESSIDILVTANSTDGSSSSETFTISVTDIAESLQLANGGVTFTDTGVSETEILGGDGNDAITLNAAGGDASGGDGNDTILGLAGNDTIDGGAGNDDLDGGDGDDTLATGTGLNTVRGSLGSDTIAVTSAAGIESGVDIDFFDTALTLNVTLSGATGTIDKGASGTDTISGIDQLVGDQGDYLNFSSGFGDDTYSIDVDPDLFVGIDARGGDDTINVINGFVRVSYLSATTSGITYNSDNGARVSGTVTGNEFGTDTLINVNEIRGSDLDDTFNGGDGDERFILRGGNDTVDGGAGVDLVRFDRNGIGAVTVDLEAGTATGTINGNAFSHTLSNIERIRGSRNDDDTISGSAADETLEGRGGNDVIDGRGGNDFLLGEDGDDELRGGEGFDDLRGGDGNDILDGGLDDDYIDGGAGDDDITVGSGFDTVVGSTGSDTVTILSGAGVVLDYANLGGTISVTALDADATVTKSVGGTDTVDGFAALNPDFDGVDFAGGAGNDSFLVDRSDDLFFNAIGRAGDDTFEVIGGWLRVDYHPDSSGGITYTGNAALGARNSGSVTGLNIGTDTLINVSEIRGTDFDDTFNGGDGDERFILRGGNDTVDGGNGFDTVRFDRNGMGPVTVDLLAGTATGTFNGNAFSHTLSNVERIRGSRDDDDTISGTAASERFDGRGGNDQLFGLGGDDDLNGEDGDDRLEGGDGNDDLNGGAGDDTLDGGDGDDSLSVGDGFNTVIGSAGSDTINVAGSIDTFFDYEAFGSALTVTLNGTTGSVVKSGTETDTIIAIDQLDPFNDSLSMNTGAGNDVFNIDVGDLFVGIDSRGGDDTFNVTSGAVRVSYRSGTSGIVYNSDNGSRVSGTVTGADFGTDSLSNVNEIRGTDHNDTFNGGDGDERFILRGGNDTVDGGAGFDTVRFDRSGIGPVTVDLATGMATGTIDGNAFSHTLSNVERVRGSRNDDDIILGSGANERFDGRGGNDELRGRDGDDQLNGEGGDDILEGGQGWDSISTGDGNDIIVIGADALNESDWVGDFNPSDDTIDIEGALTTLSSAPAALSDVLQIADYGGQARLIWFADNGDVREIMTLNGLGAGDQVRIQTSPGVSQLVTVVSGITVTGTSGDDFMPFGTIGNDTFFGLEGNDNIHGAGGDDFIDGGVGRDQAEYWGASSGVFVDLSNNTANDGDGGTDTLLNMEGVTGSDFDDIIIGNGEDGDFNGNGGNDEMYAGGGNDYLTGNDGNDQLFGEGGDDGFDGGAGDDTIDGGSGMDNVGYFNASSGINATLDTDTGNGTVSDGDGGTDTLISIESINGSQFGDTLTLTGSTNGYSLHGDAGNDILNGSDGEDYLDGGDGDDQHFGNGGNDAFGSSQGDDSFDGGAGSDNVSYFNAASGISVTIDTDTGLGSASDGDGGTDSLTDVESIGGSMNDDTLTLTGSTNGFSLNGDAGNDTLTGSDGEDYLDGGDGDDQHFGNGGNDAFGGSVGNDTFDGGAGDDNVSYFNAGSGVSGTYDTTASAGTLSDGDGGTDTLSNVESIGGSQHDDTLTLSGTTNGFSLFGDGGNDLLTGGDAFDFIDGGDGDDTLNGGAGDDGFVGGAGNDTVDGGANFDTMNYYDATFSVIAVYDTDTASGTVQDGFGSVDTLTNIEQISGSAQDDAFTLTGSGSGYWITGGQGNDDMGGSAGNDFIAGDDDDDRIAGAGGDDYLEGGSGQDTFVFFGGDGFDTIADFELGIDDIDLQAYGLSGIGDLTLTQDVNDTVITGLGSFQEIRLSNINSGDLDNGDFLF